MLKLLILTVWSLSLYPIRSLRLERGLTLKSVTISNSATFLCLSQTRSAFLTPNVFVFLCFVVVIVFLWFEVRGDCSFCWYWWNCGPSLFIIVRDSSVVRRHYIFLLEPLDIRELYIRKTADLLLQLWVSTFPRFVAIGFYFLYQKPLYKSLHQSFFYSFITILSSESGIALYYSTILP